MSTNAIDKKNTRGIKLDNTGEGEEVRPNAKLRECSIIANIDRVGGYVNYFGKREDE